MGHDVWLVIAVPPSSCMHCIIEETDKGRDEEMHMHEDRSTA